MAECEKKFKLVMVRMEEEMRKWIEEEARELDITMSDVIRRCVRKEMKR